MVMVDYNVLDNNQLLLNQFKTQAFTIGKKQPIIIREICQVKKGGTLSLILTIFFLLYQKIITSLNYMASWNIMILLANIQQEIHMQFNIC
jgi:hypothetical protein